MKPYYISSLLVILFYSMAGCSNKNYPAGNYQQTAVTADGDLGEWSTPLRFGSSEGQVQYNVTNDNENIYISMQTHDATVATKILRSGVEVYIDPAAGKSKKMSIVFPLADSAAGNAKRPGSKTGGDFKQSLLTQDTSFITTGFKNMDNRSYNINANNPVKIAIKMAPNGGLGYEAVIPLKYIFDGGQLEKTGQPINVGLVINAMKGGAESHSSSTGSARPSSGMHGGGHGGGRGGNHSNSGNSGIAASAARMPTVDRASLYKEDSNWYKFTLAVKK